MNSDILSKIASLKENLGAAIVAHNYQRPEIQDIADFTGDSLELARLCTQIKARIIVFCGVHFMAETVSILNPDKTVLLTEPTAGCPMAEMISADMLRNWKNSYPDAKVVSYVNSTAAVKAESYCCCTSANGISVVNSIPSDRVLFVPDQNLGQYISSNTDKQIILFPGYCYVHHRINPKQVKLAQKLHPEAELIVHPECRPEVVSLADAVLSTSQMLRYVRSSSCQSFIIGTEEGIIYPLKKANPQKSFYNISAGQVCFDMKKTTLETLAHTMETGENRVTVPEFIRDKAKTAVERMITIG